jgi:hypothetical protein
MRCYSNASITIEQMIQNYYLYHWGDKNGRVRLRKEVVLFVEEFGILLVFI